ncbi:MAG: hypothetical protein ACI837_001714 [Crocinitomicaceae bacterium]|jgi:hypothetical protein
MIKRFIPLLLVLVACGPAETTPFCECMIASDNLNNAQAGTQTELIDEEVTLADVDTKKLKDLQDAKKKACADYETISGTEAAQLKKACASNETE